MDMERLAPMLRAARTFGRLVAQGLLDHAEALAALIDAASAASVRGDPSGWRTWLAWTLADATRRAALDAGRTDTVIRRALAPLIAERRRSAELLATARAANAAAGDVLLPHHVGAIVRAEIAWALRRGMAAHG